MLCSAWRKNERVERRCTLVYKYKVINNWLNRYLTAYDNNVLLYNIKGTIHTALLKVVTKHLPLLNPINNGNKRILYNQPALYKWSPLGSY